MKRALLLCHADPSADPRPFRMRKWLNELDFKVDVVSSACNTINLGEEFIPLPHLSEKAYTKFRIVNLFLKALLFLLQLLVPVRSLMEPKWQTRIVKQLLEKEYQLILCCDLDLLPIASKIKRKSKLIFDAREFYPKQFEDRFIWKMTYGKLAQNLCHRYLGAVDKLLTVSPGLRSAYKEWFGLDASLLRSYTDKQELEVSPVDPDNIRLIYHGNANSSRSIEVMIDMVKQLDARFSMDFMVLPEQGAYINFLKDRAAGEARIKFVKPQKLENIVSFINQYDIGVFLVPPKNFNLRHCLPNKFFEFIQARLAIAIGPSPDMKDLTEEYGIGVVSEGWEASSLASRLNSLTAEEIYAFKKASALISTKLNSEENARYFKIWCKELYSSAEAVKG